MKFGILLGLFVSATVFAQTSTTTLPQTSASTTKSKVFAKFASSNLLGRVQELQDSKGPRLRSKNEPSLGFTTESGYGAWFTGTFSSYYNGDTARNFSEMNDPSLNLIHPIYSNGSLTVTGRLRQFFPVSNSSNVGGVSRWLTTYYFDQMVKMPAQMELRNSFFPGYATKAKYNEGDNTLCTRDLTTFGKKLNSTVALGIGQYSQIENRFGKGSASAVEIFPYAELGLAKGVTLVPRIYFPLHVEGKISGAPTSVGLANAQGELYLSASM